ncbi:MAG: hypothetical protein B6I34_00350 [Anaerolineaceae bacterium 4572_32.1]|nr:MAG: hypothetical protein B6I34_00350 [Anaerolineaceae bacterium 4572_32.1]
MDRGRSRTCPRGRSLLGGHRSDKSGRANMNEHSQKSRQNEEGQSIILLAATFIAFIAIVGLAIDLGLVYIERVKIARAVDAAALAAVQELPNEQLALLRAIEYLENNGYDLTNSRIEYFGTVKIGESWVITQVVQGNPDSDAAWAAMPWPRASTRWMWPLSSTIPALWATILFATAATSRQERSFPKAIVILSPGRLSPPRATSCAIPCRRPTIRALASMTARDTSPLKPSIIAATNRIITAPIETAPSLTGSSSATAAPIPRPTALIQAPAVTALICATIRGSTMPVRRSRLALGTI